MGQIKVEKNAGGIQGLCVIEPAVPRGCQGILHGDIQPERTWRTHGLDMRICAGQPVQLQQKASCAGLHLPEGISPGQAGEGHQGCMCLMWPWILRSGSRDIWQMVRRRADRGEQESSSTYRRALPTGSWYSADVAEFCYKCTDFYHPGRRGRACLERPGDRRLPGLSLKGAYKGSASAEGYHLADGTALNLSEKEPEVGRAEGYISLLISHNV